MQQTRKRLEGPGSKTRIADLRAQFNNASGDLAKPPKPRKAVQRDTEEERAIKAERQALAQHTTSLLGGRSSKNYQRPGERAERKSGGFVLQLLLVILIAGGVAYALDPTIIPQEWLDQAHDFIGQYIKI